MRYLLKGYWVFALLATLALSETVFAGKRALDPAAQELSERLSGLSIEPTRGIRKSRPAQPRRLARRVVERAAVAAVQQEAHPALLLRDVLEAWDHLLQPTAAANPVPVAAMLADRGEDWLRHRALFLLHVLRNERPTALRERAAQYGCTHLLATLQQEAEPASDMHIDGAFHDRAQAWQEEPEPLFLGAAVFPGS